MTLLGLSGLLLVSLFGPLLATVRRTRVPVVVGELAIGALIGRSGFGWAHPADPIFSFLAEAGFALVMMVAGSHVPVRDARLRGALAKGGLITVAVGLLSVPVAWSLSHLAGTGHTAVYAVVLASSSAALVMPVVQEDRLAGADVLTMLAQVVVADTACIVALPLAVDPSKAGRSALGAVVVIAAAAALFFALRALERDGVVAKVHRESVQRTFGLEMRLSLATLFALAGLAQNVHVSVMLAGFAIGLVLAGLGTPRRLGRQLFGVTEGFLGPIFFLWLGATVDLGALFAHPKLVLLAVGLAAGTLIIHAGARLVGQPLPLALLAAAQLGVPVAAVTLGTQNHMLVPGEGGAILAAALVTVGVASAAGGVAASRQPPQPSAPGPTNPSQPGAA
ncbi:cation:proton antiporter [Acidothermaceae bacterium B102]|nr:cation:proton antiporter [Acidothermaceae bacterium B102]